MRAGTVGKPKKNKKGSVPMPAVPVLKRAIIIELIPTKEQEEEFKELGNLCSKLWDQVNYERRRQFFNGKLGKHNVDIKGTYTYDPLRRNPRSLEREGGQK